jgi:hypothetical protein
LPARSNLPAEEVPFLGICIHLRLYINRDNALFHIAFRCSFFVDIGAAGRIKVAPAREEQAQWVDAMTG